METIAPSEKRAVTKAAADPSTKRRVRTMTPRREMMEIEGKGKQVDEKLDHDGKGVDKKDAPEVVPRPPEGFLLSIVARTVAELQATTGDNSTASYHWIRLLCKFGSFYPEATKYLESTELFEDLYGLVEQKQEYGVADKIADQLPDEYFSLVFLLTKAPEQVEKLCQSHFLNRLLLEGYTVARAKPICALVKKLCAANKNVLKAIMNLVGKAIGERHHEITRPLYRVLTALVLQKDAADAKLRPALIMGGLCAAYANNELKYKEGDFLAEQIIRLAETSSDCAAWLQKAKAGVNLVLEFLQNRKEEKKQVWNEGDQVVARYKHERGVYAGDVMKCHGDDTYYIQYDDGDVWDRAPGDKIRPRLMPRLNLTEGLDTEAYPISGGEQALHPQTVKTLQFVLKNHSPRVNNELPELTGILDEVTVFALQDLLRQSFEFERSGKLDEETIKHLQYYLDRNFVSQQKNPMKEYPDQSEMFEPDGVLNPLTKFFVRKWLGLMVTTISTQQAKEELEGHVKQHVAERDEIGFHKKGRLYTITCEFAPYGRSVAEKVTSLQKILKGEPLASGGYDSEDEREGREFKVGQSVDAWDDYFMRWKVATVSRVTSDTVTVKFERTGSRGDVDVQYSYDVRRPKLRARFHTYPRADPHVLPEAGKFSKLYK